MSRRIAGLGLAAILALVGTAALVAYVTTAEQRALAGEELVDVHVVIATIPAGTPAEQIGDHVTVEQVPAKVRPVGSVSDLGALAGQVTAVDLVPGEQLVAGRFVPRSEQTSRETGIEIPEGMVEVTIETDAERGVGGLLEPGLTAAVFASFDASSSGGTVAELGAEALVVPSSASDPGGGASHSTDLLLRKVLITAVQEPGGRSQREQRATTAPGGALLVTLAVDPFDAERLVFTAEFGRVWLAIERDTVPEVDPPGQTRDSVLLGRADTQ
jgi:pilus assembly protein CpaB